MRKALGRHEEEALVYRKIIGEAWRDRELVGGVFSVEEFFRRTAKEVLRETVKEGKTSGKRRIVRGKDGWRLLAKKDLIDLGKRKLEEILMDLRKRKSK